MSVSTLVTTPIYWLFSKVRNLAVGLFRFIVVTLEGAASLLIVLGQILMGLLNGQRPVSILLLASSQRRIMAFLRAFFPNIRLPLKLIKSYENNGTAVVTRREDVLDVLSRDADFEVVYGPRMRKLTDGDNFFLGMQPGWDYERDVSDMRLAARRDDVDRLIAPRAKTVAEECVIASGGHLDVPQMLSLQVPWDMTDKYFGTGGPNSVAMKEWTTTLFWYLFGDLNADSELDKKAMVCASALREYLDTAVAQRKANPTQEEDILNRCLALQSSNTPGMSDIGIRNNILGLLIGAIPTISKASCLALDELMNRPEKLAEAQQAARDNRDDDMAQYIWEALRFNPHNPVIYRRATRDTVIARSTFREKHIKQGDMVFAANLSAMFDRYEISNPTQFETDRPWETYIHWGYGMHTCFGDAINRTIIPIILKPLLQQKNLRRAPGINGQIDTNNTPFPVHFHVLFDATK